MNRIDKILIKMKNNPNKIRYNDLYNVCKHYFGEPRQNGTSHAIFKTTWQGDPRINIQNNRGMAKSYQVIQVLKAIVRLENENTSK